MKILVIGGLPRSLINFRSALLKEFVARGHEVTACANGEDLQVRQKLQDMGISYSPIYLSRSGMNPLEDVLTFLGLLRLLTRLHPDIMFAYTMKPAIYGGLAAYLCRIPLVYSLITGLGYSFMGGGAFKNRVAFFIIRILLKLSLRHSKIVFFQNRDDKKQFIEQKIVLPRQVVVVPGSGVDLQYYDYSPVPEDPIFLLLSRLIADKGIREYVAAAARIKDRFPGTRFLLAGGLDCNPSAIRKKELNKWIHAGIVEYLGYKNDVRPVIKACRCLVHPSHREGIPRSVLEAMSIGRPIITTDTAGCRETIVLAAEERSHKNCEQTVILGENGYLVKTGNVDALENAMARLLLHPGQAIHMARRSREIAQKKFDVNIVNSIILNSMGLE